MTNTANSVDVYRNLHKDVWSVRSRYRQDYGRVIGHETWLTVFNATFVVLERGRQRVLAEGRKNVHAFVRGEMEDKGTGCQTLFRVADLRDVTYNPYRFGYFYDRETLQPVRSARAVVLRADGKVRYLPDGTRPWDVLD